MTYIFCSLTIHKPHTRWEPEDLQVIMWESGRKVTDEYTEEDWKKINIKSIVNKYTKHPSAAMFAAQKADSQVFNCLLKHLNKHH